MKYRKVCSIVVVSLAVLFSTPRRGAPESGRPLSMSEAIGLAIRNNLSTQLAHSANEQARGQALQAAAGLLPQLTASMQQAHIYKVNLQSQGFPDNGSFNPLMGPFNSFDARIRLVQNILDLSSFWKFRAGRDVERVAWIQEQLAREQVAAAAALSYIEAQRSERAVAAAQAEVKLSQSLLQLARDQRQAGVSTGIDVARAETRAAQENLRLIRAQVATRTARLRLKRVIGLDLSQEITLLDIPRVEASLPLVEKAVSQAERSRFELQIARQQLEADSNALQSARAENYPALRALADYGLSGSMPDNTARTGSIGGRLDIPILSGGGTHGRTVEFSARRDQSESRYRDLSIQIEEDVRLALQTLEAEIEETKTADLAVSLARKELTMARDRFAAGVGDNIQVLNAQTVLDRALDDQVEALARYDTSRVNLASALGQAQQFQ